MTRGCVGRRGYGLVICGGFLFVAFVVPHASADDVIINGAIVVDANGCWSGVKIENGQRVSSGIKQDWTLQTAIDNAANGHLFFDYATEATITLGAPLKVSNSVTIGSLGGGQVWLAGTATQTGTRSDGLLVTAGTVRIENLGFKQFDNAIVIGDMASNSAVTATLYKNVIGGNDHDGVQVNGTNTTASFLGNRIGVDKAGTSMWDNGRNGIAVDGGAKAYIGNGDPTARNVITANGYNGILVSGDSTAEIIGNYVGLGSDGKVITYDNDGSKTPGGNRGSGISVEKSNAIIDRNVISGNHTGGITLADAKSVSITKNLIGTDASGLRPAFINEINKAAFGNGGEGIAVRSYENNSTGEVSQGNSPGMVVEGNTIAYSAGNGVSVEDPTTIIPIRGNSIFGSGTLGIDVLADGYVTPEIDSKTGGKTGALNFPMIETVDLDGSKLNVRGYLDTECGGDLFTLDFFANAVPDTYGYGEGQTYLGSWTLTGSRGTGDHRFAFDARLPINSVLTRQRYLTATATDASGHTSEFSLAIEIEGSIPTVVPLPSPALMSLGGLGVLAGVHVVRGRRRRVER